MARPKSKVIDVRVVGPLEPLKEALVELLRRRGYMPLTRVQHLQVMTHLSKWMSARELEVSTLTSVAVDEYLAQRRTDGYSSFYTRACLTPLLQVLADAGAPLNSPDLVPLSGVDALFEGYARFLRQERGLVASTIAAYVLRARRFLSWHGHGTDLAGVNAGVVTSAVAREAEMVSAGSTQFFVVALRSFLRYCFMSGLIGADLSGASLPVTGRRRSVLPRGISTTDARALLRACDRRTAIGRRDYAVIVLLARLGLRACEVAALRLEDLDWRAGVITIRGKGARVDQLPLPVDVGQAVAGYLRHGRPREVHAREVFLRSLAPHGPLTREAVGCLVRRASIRAGLPGFGPHRLRHALACDMLRAGVPPYQIGAVLRHQDALSTSIYARVDLDRLRTVAAPWPSTGGIQ